MSRRDYLNDPKAPIANSLAPATSAVIANTSGKILLHRRKDNEMWGLPGGTMEIGESVIGCLIREVKEETGLDIIPIYLIGVYSDPRHVISYSNGEIRQEFSLCFACKAINNELHISNESTAIAYFSRKEIANLAIHPSIRQRIEDYWGRGRQAKFS